LRMSKTSSIPLPAAHPLRKLGRDLALGRRKRGISTRDMAARLFVSRDTLWRMERGDQFIGSSAPHAGVLAPVVEPIQRISLPDEFSAFRSDTTPDC